MLNWSLLKPFLILLIFVVLAGIYWLIQQTAVYDLFIDMDSLILRIRQLGITGPLMVIGLMILAIVVNPLPSAPIALAAGAVYGHTLGTLYIITGACIGAVTAFLIARFSGHKFIKKHVGNRFTLGRWGSQNALMSMVFLSRLLPFMSFDLVSYGAGLTSITLWRFTVATIFGLIPASFLLAHFGGEMMQADLQTMGVFILLAGLITLIPVLFKVLKTSSQPKPTETSRTQK